MINFKKMDDKDFVFINKSLSTQEEKEFSDFLKSRRKKARQIRARKKIKLWFQKLLKDNLKESRKLSFFEFSLFVN
jgi:hypothetical protein